MIERVADLSFTVFGTPQHQGNHRSNRAGYTYETNKNLAPWREDAIYCARAARDRDLANPFLAGVLVKVRFFYARPLSHYGTGRNAGKLKASAPLYKETAPDLDKLQRAVGDVLSMASVLRDDAKIVQWDSAKLWDTEGRVEISIWSMDAQFDAVIAGIRIEEQPLLTT